MPKGIKKEHLPEKICPVCNKPFTWRKKMGQQLGTRYLLLKTLSILNKKQHFIINQLALITKTSTQ